jgi:hypothetical protein
LLARGAQPLEKAELTTPTHLAPEGRRSLATVAQLYWKGKASNNDKAHPVETRGDRRIAKARIGGFGCATPTLRMLKPYDACAIRSPPA